MHHPPLVYGLPSYMTLILITTGCSWDDLQRTGYQTVESVRLQQCLDKPDQACPAERIPYQDFQAERDRLRDGED